MTEKIILIAFVCDLSNINMEASLRFSLLFLTSVFVFERENAKIPIPTAVIYLHFYTYRIFHYILWVLGLAEI